MDTKKIKQKFFDKYNLLTLLGPTASGKTSFAARLAYILDAEIISADSRQVYKGMDIGTGKDLEDYTVDDKQIPYHLIDIAKAGEKYNLFRYQKDFFEVFKNIINRNKIPLLCGGTGLYLDAVVRNYKLLEVPENKELRKELEKKSLEELANILASMKKLHNKTDIDTKKRAIRAIEIELYYKEHLPQNSYLPEIKALVFGIKFDRQSQRKRITERLKMRLQNGMIQEVKKLLDNGVPAETLIYYGLEYKFITLYLTGNISYNEMFDKLNTAIHRFAKRQMTFFRRMERLGVKIHWLDGYMSVEEKIKRIADTITNS